jgi:hypothetical protein
VRAPLARASLTHAARTGPRALNDRALRVRATTELQLAMRVHTLNPFTG